MKGDAPSLSFAIDEAGAVNFAAVPTMRFRVRIGAGESAPVESIVLCVQIRIAPGKRGYDDDTRSRLVEVFGQREQWTTTMRTLLWTQATVVVPSFIGSTVVELPVSCTYDFDVVATKLFDGIRDGDIPLEFLFSGTLFYTDDDGHLRTARISWDQEATFQLPTSVWKAVMAHYFPQSAWLRLSRDAFDRLYRYRTQNVLGTWDEAVDHLLEARSIPAGASLP